MTPATPTPQQQPVPTGTTPPAKRRLFLVLLGAFFCIIAYGVFFGHSSTPAKHRSRYQDSDAVASEDQIAAAMEAAKHEAEEERLKHEREEALRKAHGQAKTAPEPRPKVVARSGGGGGYAHAHRAASSIVFDVNREERQGPDYLRAVTNPYNGNASRPAANDQRIRALQIAREALLTASRSGGTASNPESELQALQELNAAPRATDDERRDPPMDHTAALEKRHSHLLDPDPDWPTTILPEGSVLEAVLKNRLEGATDGPVDVMVTTDVYQRGTHNLVFPAGTEIIGESRRVNVANQDRLAVTFHSALVELSGGKFYRVSLDDPALDQQGGVGLHDKVDHHYLQIFGVSLAVGAIGGLVNIGNSYGGLQGYDTLSSIRSGIGSEMGMSAQRIMSFYLNRLPTIVIREGTRVRIMLTEDLQVPYYPEEETAQ